MSIEYKLLPKADDDIKVLWKEIFGDTDQFIEYYFRDVSPKTLIFAAFDGDKKIGMMNLNPYNVYMYGKQKTVYYVVGVAVKEEYRKRGIMRDMMCTALDYMNNENVLFTFLMPENEAYYRSLGYESIYNTRKLKFETDFDTTFNIEETQYRMQSLDDLEEGVLSNIAESINVKLSECYDVYSIRDYSYLKNMVEEHLCQNGNVYALWHKDDLVSLFSVDKYGEYLGIERFADFAVIDKLDEILNSVAVLYNCSEYELTISSKAYNCKILSNSIKMNQSYDGKGIMAKTSDILDKIDISMLKNHSFFDEIV